MSAVHPTQPFAVAPMNDRFGKTVAARLNGSQDAMQPLAEGSSYVSYPPNSAVADAGEMQKTTI